jgi:hypothetical protein
MKQAYERPEFSVILLKASDILKTSIEDPYLEDPFEPLV